MSAKIQLWLFVSVLLSFLFNDIAYSQQQNSHYTHALSIQDITAYNGVNSYFNILQDTTIYSKPPALGAGRITGQFFGGAMIGGVLGLIGIWIGSEIPCHSCNSVGDAVGDAMGKAFIGASIGYVLGSSLGVYSFGNTSKRTASYPAVLLGDVIGLGLGVGVLYETANTNSDFVNVLTGIAVFGLPLAGAIIAYNLTRRYRDGIVLYSHRKFNVVLNMPKPTFLRTTTLAGKNFTPAISIINISF